MSKQDSRFINVFSLIIGLLVVTALVLIGVARAVHGHTQREQAMDDPQYAAAVAERIAKPVRVAVAGQDNSALAIAQPAAPQPGTADAAADSTAGGGEGTASLSGTDAYQQACSACHGQGIAGAPKAGDKAAWAPRIAQGTDTLHKHAIEGYTGKSGVMPPKGGRIDLSDDVVKAAVDHMVQLSR